MFLGSVCLRVNLQKDWGDTTISSKKSPIYSLITLSFLCKSKSIVHNAFVYFETKNQGSVIFTLIWNTFINFYPWNLNMNCSWNCNRPYFSFNSSRALRCLVQNHNSTPHFAGLVHRCGFICIMSGPKITLTLISLCRIRGSAFMLERTCKHDLGGNGLPNRA